MEPVARERGSVHEYGWLADNVGWLDFTHALTFAEAAAGVVVRGRICGLPCCCNWPASSVGNADYIDAGHDTSRYAVRDPKRFLDDILRDLFTTDVTASSSLFT